jgi:hypothetical protein
MKLIIITTLIVYFHLIYWVTSKDDSELQINILPSEKYKINKRDLLNLKSDIERQVIYL